MLYRMKFRVPLVISCLAIIGVLNTALSMPHLAAQTPTAGSSIVFHTDARLPTAPVMITGVFINGQQITSDKPTYVAGQWLKTLQVYVKNVSTKTITRGDVQIIFPETSGPENTAPIVMADVSLGLLPSEALFRKDGTKIRLSSEEQTRSPLSIPPNGSAIFTFENSGNEIQSEAYAQSNRITQALITLRTFYFQDHSRYLQGYFSTPTSSNGAWKTISARDFYLASPN